MKTSMADFSHGSFGQKPKIYWAETSMIEVGHGGLKFRPWFHQWAWPDLRRRQNPAARSTASASHRPHHP
eukprot:scaffold239187_cov17-Prasinocladus_malaysianus.AAC.2